MKTHRSLVAAVLAVLALIAAPAAAQQATAARPIQHAAQIAAYMEQDKSTPPPQEAILFIGSSIFRQWANVKEHMAPLPVFNRAFGGSRTWEVLHYMDQVVIPYRPRVIVFYCGSNDINAGEPATAIVGRFEEFVARVHAKLPQTRVIFAAVLKAPQKRDAWATVEAVNASVSRLAASSPHVDFVDINPVVFDNKGEPRLELYRPDGLHYHPPAYDEFARVIRPVVEKVWREAGK